MTGARLYRRHGFPPDVISHAVQGLVAQIGDQAEDPFSRCLSRDGLDLGSSEGRGAVHDGDADVDLGGLTIRVR